MTTHRSLEFSLIAVVKHCRTCLSLCLASTLVGLTFMVGGTWAETSAKAAGSEKHVIGSTAIVEETESNFSFPARVDTGATTTSLHVEGCKIENEATEMGENVGKTIRFRIKNQRGESEWLKRKIAEISVIKTSEREERRYKVPVTLCCMDVKKQVLVSLNDRSHMTFPLLLGRNFLQGDFVVDVDWNQNLAEKSELPAKQQEKRTPHTVKNNVSQTQGK